MSSFREPPPSPPGHPVRPLVERDCPVCGGSRSVEMMCGEDAVEQTCTYCSGRGSVYVEQRVSE